jgi:hypothetical protein
MYNIVSEPAIDSINPNNSNDICMTGYINLLNNIKELTKDNDCLLLFLDECKNINMDTPRNYKIPIDNKDKCYRITKKNTKFYNKQYNPYWMTCLIDQLKLRKEDIDNIKKMFDLKPRINCCNCISIVLYISNLTYGSDDSDIIRFKYLQEKLNTMCMTLRIVSKALPDFVVRYYLDSSIFETLKYIITNKIERNYGVFVLNVEEIIKNLKFIITHENSEVYIYFCESILQNPKYIQRTRTYRFLPFLDNTEIDTNVCVIREADGFVSLTDCHNIRLFTKDTTEKVLMVYNFASSVRYLEQISHQYNMLLFGNEPIKLPQITNLNHYSAWLNIYENIFKKNTECLDQKYKEIIKDDNKLSFIDILAGVFAIKVHLNKEYITNIINYVNTIYDILNNTHYLETVISLEPKIKEKEKEKEKEHQQTFIDGWKKYIIMILEQGYDEILLMELFAPLIRVSFTVNYHKSNSLNLDEITQKSSLIDMIIGDDPHYDNFEEKPIEIKQKLPTHNLKKKELRKQHDLYHKSLIPKEYQIQRNMQIKKIKNPNRYIFRESDLLNNDKISNEKFEEIYATLFGPNIYINAGGNTDERSSSLLTPTTKVAEGNTDELRSSLLTPTTKVGGNTYMHNKLTYFFHCY